MVAIRRGFYPRRRKPQPGELGPAFELIPPSRLPDWRRDFNRYRRGRRDRADIALEGREFGR